MMIEQRMNRVYGRTDRFQDRERTEKILGDQHTLIPPDNVFELESVDERIGLGIVMVATVLEAFEHPWIKLRTGGEMLYFPIYRVRLVKQIGAHPPR